ncbi:MAG: hypothetical protein KKC66_04575 [Candidatus Omnitrophica bacterium]|nr:hypothetical protein [Candidatus Omnitrophota bacterium]MBU1933155.1 hypothetical protein [Candidatus Omnitrophota bacterium]
MVDFQVIKEILMPYLEALKDLKFTYDNPLFWAGLIILFIVLSRAWTRGSAFSFSFLIALILLGTTKLEALVADIMIKNGSTFDPLLIRIFSGFLIAIILVYYAFMKEA